MNKEIILDFCVYLKYKISLYLLLSYFVSCYINISRKLKQWTINMIKQTEFWKINGWLSNDEKLHLFTLVKLLLQQNSRALWDKLLLNNINGKMYCLILNMYDNIKSCVVYNIVNLISLGVKTVLDRVRTYGRFCFQFF